MTELKEIPIWAIWSGVVVVAFIVGLGWGYLLQGPETWRPWKKKKGGFGV